MHPRQVLTQRRSPLILDLLGNKVLDTGEYTIHIVLAPAKGHLSQNPNSSFPYKGHPDTFGNNSFSYFIKDEDGSACDVVTVTVELLSENDAPVFSGATQGLPLNTTVEDTKPIDVFRKTPAMQMEINSLFFLQGPDAALFSIDQLADKLIGNPKQHMTTHMTPTTTASMRSAW